MIGESYLVETLLLLRRARLRHACCGGNWSRFALGQLRDTLTPIKGQRHMTRHMQLNYWSQEYSSPPIHTFLR